MSSNADKTHSTAPAWQEAAITINGHALTFGQSMTVRCALENMSMSLALNGLGDDDGGRATDAAYQSRIDEIRDMIYGK